MSPISYQGPMAEDESPKHTHSQTTESNLGVGQPGRTVAAILADKGDDIYTVTPHTTVMEMVGELTRLRVGALVVVDSSNVPIGIVSERDISQSVEHKGLGVFECPVEDIMTPNPQTCSPNDKTEDILKLMTDGGFRHMPVTEAGKLSGLVSMRDVARHLVLEVEYEYLKMKQAIVG
jgi:CBS domain-containing protein